MGKRAQNRYQKYKDRTAGVQSHCEPPKKLIYQLQYSSTVEHIIDPPLVGDRKEKRAVLKIDVVIVVPDEPRDLAVAADRREALHAQQSKFQWKRRRIKGLAGQRL
jgi:hypothetical protein